ncbi:MAG: aminopeptidase [Candidatus Bathyarchaeia archaeon]|nr:aminopeptidase [Candidatus Bathyarchaeota archaeon A05DMB-4]
MFRSLPLMRGARIAVEVCMNVKPEETVLVMTDTGKVKLAEAFAYASSSLGATTVVSVMAPLKRSGLEPPKPIAEAMKAADVVLIPTSTSFSHTDARREASKSGARIASMPGITEEMMSVGGLTADYREVERLTNVVSDILDKGKTVKITSPSGTDLTMSIEGRLCLRDTGIYHGPPNTWGNLPAGEACLAPVEGTTEGVLVIDSMGKLVSQPVRVTIKHGRAVKFEGVDAKRLENLLRQGDENAFNVGELGVGTNEKARLSGAVLEDEKVLGTVHVALGDNSSYPGGHSKSNIHMDGILLAPTVMVDEVLLMKDGKIRVV